VCHCQIRTQQKFFSSHVNCLQLLSCCKNDSRLRTSHIKASITRTVCVCGCNCLLCAPFHQAFLIAATHSWNGLPPHVASASSLPVSRACLKTYLFSLSLYLERSTSTPTDHLSTSSECPSTLNSLPQQQQITLTSSLPVSRACLKTYLFSLSSYLEQSTSTPTDHLSTSSECPRTLNGLPQQQQITSTSSLPVFRACLKTCLYTLSFY